MNELTIQIGDDTAIVVNDYAPKYGEVYTEITMYESVASDSGASITITDWEALRPLYELLKSHLG